MPATAASKRKTPRRFFRPKLTEDVLPFTEVRKNLAECIKRTRTTHRPIIITQNGRATSVIADLADLEGYLEALEIRRDIEAAEAEIARGETLSRADVESALRAEGLL